MAIPQTDTNAMDWWYREKQRRQKRVLLFLILVLVLIGFFYWRKKIGVVGTVGDLPDTFNQIAFVHQDVKGDISLYLVGADGTKAQKLTAEEDRSTKQDPAWTTNGESLLYVSNKRDGRITQVYILGNGETKQLTVGTGNKFAPVALPDGSRAAFVTQGSIKTILLNGEDVLQVLPPPQAGSAHTDDPNEIAEGIEPQGPMLNAVFSADSRGIAGVQTLSVEDNPARFGDIIPGDQIARVVPPGGDRALILDNAREISVAWDPTGPRLAVAYAEAEVKVNGKDQMISGINLYDFSKGQKPEARPILAMLGYTLAPKNIAWSPDGKRIAFEGWRLKGEGDRELRGITMVDTERSGSIRTVEQAETIPYLIPSSTEKKPQNPRWSPDGTRILYEMRRADGKRDLWVVNYDGSNPINLTKDLKGDNSQGTWSPAAKK